MTRKHDPAWVWMIGAFGGALALEEEFDIEFPDEVLKKSTFESVHNIAQVIEGLVKAVA